MGSAPDKLDRFELEFSAPVSLGWEERKTMKASTFSDAQKAFFLKQGADFATRKHFVFDDDLQPMSGLIDFFKNDTQLGEELGARASTTSPWPCRPTGSRPLSGLPAVARAPFCAASTA